MWEGDPQNDPRLPGAYLQDTQGYLHEQLRDQMQFSTSTQVEVDPLTAQGIKLGFLPHLAVYEASVLIAHGNWLVGHKVYMPANLIVFRDEVRHLPLTNSTVDPTGAAYSFNWANWKVWLRCYG